MNRRWWQLGVMLALTAALAIPACRSEPRSVDFDDLPTLGQLESRVTRRDDPYPRQDAGVRLRVFLVSLPLDAPLDDVWALTSRMDLPSQLPALWRANRIDVGVLDRADYPKLAEAITNLDARSRVSEFVAASQYLPLPSGSRRRTVTELTWIERPGAAPRTDLLEPGTPQWLLRFNESIAGRTMIDLVPQMHYRENLFDEPDTLFERVTQGQVFEGLKLVMLLNPRQVLVVGFSGAKPQAAQATRVGDLLLTVGDRQVLLLIGAVATQEGAPTRPQVDRQMQELIRERRGRELGGAEVQSRP